MVVVVVVVVVVAAAAAAEVVVVVVVKCTAVPARIGYRVRKLERQTATQYGYCAKLKIKPNASKPGNVRVT